MVKTTETQDIAVDGGLGRIPQEVRTALEYVAYTAAKHCDLKNGQTALFWNLVAVLNQHSNFLSERKD